MSGPESEVEMFDCDVLVFTCGRILFENALPKESPDQLMVFGKVFFAAFRISGNLPMLSGLTVFAAALTTVLKPGAHEGQPQAHPPAESRFLEVILELNARQICD